MEKILISACLLGAKVRYHGKDAFFDHPLLQRWLTENRLISVCPEVKGGASIPRSPAEIVGIGGGKAILNRKAKIINKENIDVTEQYQKGAQITLQIAQQNNIKIAILKDGSPSCGSSYIYDGSFSSKKVSQEGVTAALLIENGIKVFNENQIEEAQKYLLNLEKD